jgi:hypothetical protein
MSSSTSRGVGFQLFIVFYIGLLRCRSGILILAKPEYVRAIIIGIGFTLAVYFFARQIWH